MRNLKKILALVLALIMSMSLMITANAFTDDADMDATYDEAISVLSNLGVFEGYEDGAFKPTKSIKRAEVAAIIYRIVTGDVNDKQADLYVEAAKFNDVKASYWGAGYIGYCYNAEFIKGYPDGSFKPEKTVTGYEALAMILRAIGYGKNNEFSGAGWDINTAALAKSLDITNNVKPGVLKDPATREVVAEILYRSILVPQVTYTPALNYVIEDVSLGYDTFGLLVQNGIVVANEAANLAKDNKETALAAGRTTILTEVVTKRNKTDYVTMTLAGTTGLDDLGESRYFVYLESTNVKDRTVLYVGNTGLNNVYATSAYAKDAAALKKAAKAEGVEWKNAVEYVNFDTVVAGTIDGNTNGNFVKVVDNDNDGIADIVLETNYILDEVYSVSAKGAVTFYGTKLAADTNLVAYEGIAAGDVVVMTYEIDGNYFVELADSFTGVTTTVSFKNTSITVDGEEYFQSYIDNNTGYAGKILDVAEKTEYTYFLDKFGYVRAYKLPDGAASEYALLTETYTQRNNNTAWITKTIGIAEVTIQDADMAEYVVNNYLTGDKGGNHFFTTTTADNKLLPAVPGAVTNIAAIAGVDEDSLSLYNAQEKATDKAGNELNKYAVDYVELLNNKDVAAGAKLYDAKNDVIVNAVHDTEYYVVDKTNGSILYFTDYAEVPAIPNELIDAAYAVATDVNADKAGKSYWVADVIVLELNNAVPGVYDTIDLVFYNDSKTSDKVYHLSAIDSEAAEDATEIWTNNTWGTQIVKNIPGFYKVFNTDKEFVTLSYISDNYATYGIHAGIIDRISAVDTRGEYIVLTDKTTLNIKDVPVYSLAANGDYELTQIVETRYDVHDQVLIDGNEGDQIIYVYNGNALAYIVLVNAFTADLYADIAAPVLTGLENAINAALAVYDVLPMGEKADAASETEWADAVKVYNALAGMITDKLSVYDYQRATLALNHLGDILLVGVAKTDALAQIDIKAAAIKDYTINAAAKDAAVAAAKAAVNAWTVADVVDTYAVPSIVVNAKNDATMVADAKDAAEADVKAAYEAAVALSDKYDDSLASAILNQYNIAMNDIKEALELADKAAYEALVEIDGSNIDAVVAPIVDGLAKIDAAKAWIDAHLTSSTEYPQGYTVAEAETAIAANGNGVTADNTEMNADGNVYTCTTELSVAGIATTIPCTWVYTYIPA